MPAHANAAAKRAIASLRCLVEAGRCRRLERRLRGEAARWLGKARDGVSKEMDG